MSVLFGSCAIICYTAVDEGPTLEELDLDLTATIPERTSSRVCNKFADQLLVA